MPPMPEQEPLNQPRSKTDLFVSFTLLALQGFGGVLAVVQRELVEKKRWMTREQFVEEWAVAQIMPGPNVVNLSLMIGGRYFGLPGALAGLAGMLCAPLVVALLLAMAFGTVSDAAWAQGALRGMGAVSAGLIAGTGIKLISALRSNPMRMPVCIALAALSFAGVALLRLPLAWVLLGTGALGCGWAWVQLARQAGEHA
ncbi:MAG: chromate transporter [Limnohabitans sp.]|nr:MAG: chromate transporter [Limnohabitans sp.]